MNNEGGIKINDVLVDPTGDYVKNYLFSLGKETPFLDYKKKISTDKDSDFPKFVKDALAFANYGGGFIFLGMEENQYLDPSVKGKFLPIGLPSNFHIEQAILQEKTNSYTNSPITIDYDEF
ncbi:MAG: ATP-binding protein [Nitrosopumilaceae archaeon]